MTDTLVAPSAIGGAFFLGPDTNFRITAFNAAASVVLTVAGQVLDASGRVYPFQHTHVPNTDRSISSQVLPMGTGWVLNAQIIASSGAPRRGQCYARLELVQGREGGSTSLGTLLQGYVTDTNALAYPGSALEPSLGDRGVLRSIAGTNPAAGAEISETVPTNARWRFLSMTAAFVTSAAVANRIPILTFDDGAAVFGRIIPFQVQAASLTFQYSWGLAGAATGQVGNQAGAGVSGPIDLMGGHRIRTQTLNLDVGDDYGAPQYLVEEWIED